MPVSLHVNTRLSWSQLVQLELNSVEVLVRMERLAAAESLRIPAREIVVTAVEYDTARTLEVVWPVGGVSYWRTTVPERV